MRHWILDLLVQIARRDVVCVNQGPAQVLAVLLAARRMLARLQSRVRGAILACARSNGVIPVFFDENEEIPTYAQENAHACPVAMTFRWTRMESPCFAIAMTVMVETVTPLVHARVVALESVSVLVYEKAVVALVRVIC